MTTASILISFESQVTCCCSKFAPNSNRWGINNQAIPQFSLCHKKKKEQIKTFWRSFSSDSAVSLLNCHCRLLPESSPSEFVLARSWTSQPTHDQW